MLESFKDIPFDKAKGSEEIDKLMQEHLQLSLQACTEALCTSLQDRAAELLDDFVTLAPNGDYGKLLDDRESIYAFLKEVASNPENWTLDFLEVKKEKDQLMELVFSNKAVDDGDNLKGFVFVGLSGKIRHVFPQVH